MAAIDCRNFDQPDETRPFAGGMGRLDLVDTGDGAVGRAVFLPGWKWSEHVQPLAGTDSCRADHTGYVVSGRMKVVMDGGESAEFGPGDYMRVHPGHNAWVVGDEPCVTLDWTGFSDYAKPSG